MSGLDNPNPKYGDIGHTFLRTLIDPNGDVVSVSSATSIKFKFLPPSGIVEEKTGTFTTTGTDGKVQYTTIAGDLDETGSWACQVKIVYSAGTFHSDWFYFDVEANVDTSDSV